MKISLSRQTDFWRFFGQPFGENKFSKKCTSTKYVIFGNTLVFWSFTTGSPHKYVLVTKQLQKNDLGLIFGVPDSKWRCTSFSFRLELWVCRFGCQATSSVFTYRNELPQGKLGYLIGAPDA